MVKAFAATSAIVGLLGYEILASDLPVETIFREFVRLPVNVDGSQYDLVVREGDNLASVLRTFCSDERFPFSDTVAQCEDPLRAEVERKWQERMLNDVALTVRFLEAMEVKRVWGKEWREGNGEGADLQSEEKRQTEGENSHPVPVPPLPLRLAQRRFGQWWRSETLLHPLQGRGERPRGRSSLVPRRSRFARWRGRRRAGCRSRAIAVPRKDR